VVVSSSGSNYHIPLLRLLSVVRVGSSYHIELLDELAITAPAYRPCWRVLKGYKRHRQRSRGSVTMRGVAPVAAL
jgi:hypothetical protein